MREVAFPAEIIEIEMIAQLYADRVRNEAAEDMLEEHVLGAGPIRKWMVGPAAMSVVDMFCAPQEIRDPADIPFGQRKAEIGKAPPDVAPDEVSEGVDGHG